MITILVTWVLPRVRACGALTVRGEGDRTLKWANTASTSTRVSEVSLRWRRAVVCRARSEHGARPDAGARAALSDGRHRLAGGVAPDLRRRGPRLGWCPGDDRRGPGGPGLRRGVRRDVAGRGGPGPLGRRRAGDPFEDPVTGPDDGRLGAGLALSPVCFFVWFVFV